VNTLAALLSHVVTVLQESGYCGAVRVLETLTHSLGASLHLKCALN